MSGVLEDEFGRLANAAREGVSEYISAYIQTLTSTNTLYATNKLTKGEIRAADSKDAERAIKVSLLYNDISFLDFEGKGSASIIWLQRKAFLNLIGDGPVTVNIKGDMSESLKAALAQDQMGLGFFHHSDEPSSQLLSDGANLISSGRLISRPKRMLFYIDKDQSSESQRSWQALEADPSSSLDTWTLSGELKSKPGKSVTETAFDRYYGDGNAREVLTGLTLPFIESVSLSDYATIIEDEGDLLVEFRQEMKTLVTDPLASKSAEEYKMDVVLPRLARIERRFRHISNMSRLKIGGATLATAVLTLIAYSTHGVAAGIEASVAGGAGILSTVKEVVDYSNQVHILKDDPMYLLWKMSYQR